MYVIHKRAFHSAARETIIGRNVAATTGFMGLGDSAISAPAANLLLTPGCGMSLSMKTVDFNELKRQEAQSRMAAMRKARRSPAAAAALQHRASLVGEGAKWRITNLNQVARAIAQWR